MTHSDASRIAARAQRVLPLVTATLPEVYYYSSLSLCVLDAVFSIGVRYESTKAVVERYCAFYGLTRIRPDRNTRPPRSLQEPLSALVHRIEAEGPPAFAAGVVRNTQRTSARNGVLKAEATARFAKVLVASGIEYFEDLPAFDESSRLMSDLRSIRGQRSGISAGYFWMLAGSDDLIKPDRMILGFLADTLERSVDVPEARRLLPEATALLRAEFPSLTPRLLDYQMWCFQREKRRVASGPRWRGCAGRL